MVFSKMGKGAKTNKDEIVMKPASVARWCNEDNPKFTDKELKEIYAWCVEERDKTRFHGKYIDEFIADYENNNLKRYKKNPTMLKKAIHVMVA